MSNTALDGNTGALNKLKITKIVDAAILSTIVIDI